MPALIRACLLVCATAGALVTAAASASAQTTAFSYQGKLTDAGAAPSGTVDLQFRLFDAVAGGTQAGPTVARDDVAVVNGVFSVMLDFGLAAFQGADRFIEVAVRPGTSGGAFTTLAPRHTVTSAPYAMRSLRAGTSASADTLSEACSGCVTTAALSDNSVTNSKIADVAGSKVTGTVPVAAVPAGSNNYIRNGTAQQTASFSISGNGTAAGILTGGDVAYLKPQTAYYAVNEAAFTSRDGVTVSKSAGLGGAFPTAPTVWGLTAPVNLPHGATITNVRFIFIDNSTSSLTLSLMAHSMTGGFYTQIASHATTVETATVQGVDVAANWLVDNTTTSLEVVVFPVGAWSSGAMLVRGVVVTYTMPRPAR